MLVHPAYATPPSVDIATPQITQQALDLNLDQHLTWRALLHIDQTTARIQDPNFLLSRQQGFSPKQELLLTLQALLDPTTMTQTYCRFPARATWLTQMLDLDIQVKTENCPDLNEFLAKAPADQIDLVYASENLYSASSMMGHVLLKLSGLNDQHRSVAHAVSFYTEVKGFNLPKILYDSVIVGKKGYFSLSPYADKHRYYAEGEQRNIWTYTLKLDPAQRRLIQLHLWELRQTQLKYFFHTYNCATFTNLILAIANHPTLSASSGWVSPLDSVKLVHDADLISSTTIAPSNRAMVRVLTERQPLSWRNDFKRLLQQQLIPEQAAGQSTTAYVETLLAAQYYAQYLADQQQITPEQAQHIVTTSEQKISSLIPDYIVDFSQYKTPTLQPKDAQMYLGLSSEDQQYAIRLGGFAASHRLEDDNRQRMSENQLRIADLTLSIETKPEPQVRIDQFSLYNMTSYLPYDPLTGGLSVAFSMGYDPLYDAQLNRRHVVQVKGGLGLSDQSWSDVTIYAMANAAVAYNRHDQAFSYVEPQIGLILNTIYDGKTLLQLSQHHSLAGRQARYLETTLTQAFRLRPDLSVVFDYAHYWHDDDSKTRWGVSFKRLF